MSRHPDPAKANVAGMVQRQEREAAERPRFDFMASSLDLAQGLDVQDLSDVTIQGELFDSLFGASTRF